VGLIGCGVAVVGGAHAARTVMASQLTWAGPLVGRLAQDCPPRSILVLAQGAPSFPAVDFYAIASTVPKATFAVSAKGPQAADRGPAACPVLGWAEHLIDSETARLSDAQLAAMIGVRGDPGRDFRIVRHASGFVVLAPLAEAPRAARVESPGRIQHAVDRVGPLAP